MELARCLRIAPVAVLVTAVVGFAPASIAPVRAAAWSPPGCRSVAAARPAVRPGRTPASRLVPVLDASGSLMSNVLTIRSRGGEHRIELPAEATAARTPDGRVLVAADDGAESVLRLVDPGHGCATVIARETAVIRSAVRLVDGDVVEHRVDRASRADLGVWRRPAGGGAPTRVLGPIEPDPRFGRTFSTELVAAADGRLVVSSCGFEACRVRVLDMDAGDVREIDGTGPAVGIADGKLVAREACGGASCRLVSVALDGSGARVVLGGANGTEPTVADPDPMLNGLFGQNEPLSFRWGSGGTPGTVMKAAILAAVDDANATRKAKAPVFGYDSTASNTIYYGTDVPCGTNGLACFRRSTSDDAFAIWLRENGHRYDWGTLRWCEPSGDPDGCYEAETITLDELGHVTGLDHHVNLPDGSDYADAVVQEFSHTKPLAGWNAHVYGRCDVAALQQAYDVLTTSTPYSTCFDVPSTTTLAVSSASVTSGSVVTFTATLRSAGTGRLSNNIVTGRTVVLQVRSGTSWVDAVTLGATATPGTYQGQLLVRSSTDVRAIFRKPSTEGLRGSASAVLTVVVSAACTWDLCPMAPAPADR